MVSRVSNVSSAEEFFSSDRPFYVHQGECLAFLQSLPDACVDGIVTDPPYCSGGRTSAERTTKSTTDKYVQSDTKRQYFDFDGDNKDQRGYLAWCALWLSECYRVAKPGAPIVVFSDWRQLPITTDAVQAGNWTWRGIAAWDKTRGCRPQRGRFAAQCEFIIWGSKGSMPLDRNVGTLPGVFNHPVKAADKHHVTGKPTPLMLDVVKIVEPGGIILDPFAGSGTTLVAGVEQGFRVIGCEWGAEYAQIARQRAEESALSAAQRGG